MIERVDMSDWFKVVQRTAKVGLDESLQGDGVYRWLSLWALDVVCEMSEFVHNFEEGNDIREAGDVLWGIAASAMLWDIEQNDLLLYRSKHLLDKPPLYYAALYADFAKKVARDRCKMNINVTRSRAVELLSDVYQVLAMYVDVTAALNAVNVKLWERYPHGYNAAASINRTV